jgi:hypothetical protein
MVLLFALSFIISNLLLKEINDIKIRIIPPEIIIILTSVSNFLIVKAEQIVPDKIKAKEK